MKPISLHLRGSIGIRDGLGLEEISIDFTRFSPGLICLVGPNGSGKTSILENIHPYLCLASRDGHLASHFYLADSYRDFTFGMGGDRYRSLILIDARTGKNEAYLYVNDIPLNDGKISSYKAALERLLGPEELFFQSIFSGQGTAGFADLTPAKRKELFFELLNLQKYDGYCQHARESAEELERQFAAKKAVIERNQEELQTRAQVLANIEQAEARRSAVQSSLHALGEEIERIGRDLAELHRSLEERISQRKEANAVDEEIRLLDVRRCKLSEHYLIEKKKHETKAEAVKKELQRIRQICSRKEEIIAHVEELHRLCEEDGRLGSLEREAYKIDQAQSEARGAYQRECDAYQRKRSTLIRDRDRLASEERMLRQTIDHELALCDGELARLRKEASLIDTVACRSIEGLPQQCVLLSNAVTARKQIPELERKQLLLRSQEYAGGLGSTRYQSELLRCDEELKSLEQSAPTYDASRFAQQKVALGYDRSRHEEVRRLVEALQKKPWDQLLEEIKIAESVECEKRSALGDIADQLSDLEVRQNRELGELEELLGKKKKQRMAIVIDEDVPDEKSWEEQRIQAKKNVERLQREELACVGDIASGDCMLQKLDAIETQTRQAEDEAHRLAARIADWRLIQRACSKDGIPALELDAAGPAISCIANRLLASSFGSRFQIRFETTRLSKDSKKQMETFDVRVFGEDGEKNIEDLSGGERVWIERAIAEAIAIHLSESSQHSFESTFQDEADGPLDPENKQNYLAMLRESFRLGHRHYTFVVTQTPDIWQQVDQRIHLEPANSRVRYVYGG
jgi:exonuclease SbcC